MSAPRSRGLLRQARLVGGEDGVGPALAGVALRQVRPVLHAQRRPRARGGCSRHRRGGVLHPRSAPRSRGLLRRARRPHPGRNVGPALAGVAPGAAGPPDPTARRPRARGGCSEVGAHRTPSRWSAPRSRGLLTDSQPTPTGTHVGPALAGVAPAAPGSSRSATGRPRARGGCSAPLASRLSTRRSAPRSRGLLQPPPSQARSPDVGPALAGVARERARLLVHREGRPRARGGCSPSPPDHRPTAASAPRSRGLLPIPATHPTRRPVGPALAGVAPPWSRRCRGTGSRPRARGGCSSPACSPARSSSSAPRSRGLLNERHQMSEQTTVGPALAGVTPEGCGPGRSGRGRPRARGGCSSCM